MLAWAVAQRGTERHSPRTPAEEEGGVEACDGHVAAVPPPQIHVAVAGEGGASEARGPAGSWAKKLWGRPRTTPPTQPSTAAPPAARQASSRTRQRPGSAGAARPRVQSPQSARSALPGPLPGLAQQSAPAGGGGGGVGWRITALKGTGLQQAGCSRNAATAAGRRAPGCASCCSRRASPHPPPAPPPRSRARLREARRVGSLSVHRPASPTLAPRPLYPLPA